jgi:hypothetical protein
MCACLCQNKIRRDLKENQEAQSIPDQQSCEFQTLNYLFGFDSSIQAKLAIAGRKRESWLYVLYV